MGTHEITYECSKCGTRNPITQRCNCVLGTGRTSEGFVRVQQVVRELAKTIERMADDEDSVCVVATADEHKARVVAGAAYRRVVDMLRAEIEKLPNVGTEVSPPVTCSGIPAPVPNAEGQTFDWPPGDTRACGICENEFDPSREGLVVESIDYGSACRCGKCLAREAP